MYDLKLFLPGVQIDYLTALWIRHKNNTQQNWLS